MDKKPNGRHHLFNRCAYEGETSSTNTKGKKLKYSEFKGMSLTK